LHNFTSFYGHPRKDHSILHVFIIILLVFFKTWLTFLSVLYSMCLIQDTFFLHLPLYCNTITWCKSQFAWNLDVFCLYMCFLWFLCVIFVYFIFICVLYKVLSTLLLPFILFSSCLDCMKSSYVTDTCYRLCLSFVYV